MVILLLRFLLLQIAVSLFGIILHKRNETKQPHQPVEVTLLSPHDPPHSTTVVCDDFAACYGMSNQGGMLEFAPSRSLDDIVFISCYTADSDYPLEGIRMPPHCP